MTRAGCRRGTIGQVDGGVGGVVFSAERTVDSVISKLATQAAGTLCPLLGIAGIPIGVWIADGAGSAFCPRATFKDRADGTEFTVGTTTASNIQIDVGSSLSWTGGITPLAGVATKIVHHHMGERDPAQVTTAVSRSVQTVSPGTLVANEFWGAGFLLLQASTAELVTMIATQYSAGWRARCGFNVWGTETFTSGSIVTFDGAGVTTCLRSPYPGSSRSRIVGDVVGDTQGPSPVGPIHPTATDGWESAGTTCVGAHFYRPQASDLAVSFECIQIPGDPP